MDGDVKNDSALRAEVETLSRRLAETDRRMCEFVARLAHELRSPLGAILMWVHVLRLDRADDRIPALDAIEVSARAQSKMIGTLLDVARALAGRLRIDQSSVDLRAPLHRAVEMLMPIANAQGVRLGVSVEGDRFQVKGDVVRLGEMVSNLVENGIRFTPSGGEVQIRLIAGGGSVRITVRDSGRGLRPEELPEIFTAFRSEGDAETRPSGLGLGLALVRLLVELHGGVISADSEGPGRGCLFTIDIPLELGDPICDARNPAV
jgi:signal transduction histidine kinase